MVSSAASVCYYITPLKIKQYTSAVLKMLMQYSTFCFSEWMQTTKTYAVIEKAYSELSKI